MSQFDSPKFKKLQNQWYQKLKKEGFNDAEKIVGQEPLLKTWHCSYFQTKYTADIFIAKKEYYELASSFLIENKFSTEKERTIWELHTKGLSVRKIARQLKIKICRIHKAVNELKSKMLQRR